MHGTTIAKGASAEARAVALLTTAGYTIVERNFRCQAGELDIVARDGEVLCFVEVRSRAGHDHGNAAETVGRHKQRQVTRVAMAYLGLRAPQFERSRFDVVALTGADVVLIKDAWRE